MSVYLAPAFTPHTSDPVVSTKTFPPAFSMISTSGLPSSAIALTRPRKC